jgi:hypothetical protein
MPRLDDQIKEALAAFVSLKTPPAARDVGYINIAAESYQSSAYIESTRGD